MFVKVRYGNRICLSETVDSKVAPVWTDEDSFHLAHANRDSVNMKRSRRAFLIQKQTGSVDGAINDFHDIAEMVNPAR